MIKIQKLRDSAVKTKPFPAYLMSFFLVFTSTIGNAESQKTTNSPNATHTRIMMHKVKPGEAPSEIFSKLGASEAHKIVSANRDRTQFTTISTDRPQEFRRLSSRFGLSSYPNFGRRFNLYTHKFNMLQLASGQGTVTSSLPQAGKKAGLSEELMNQLTQIFAWDIDFATNLHNGDRFTVVYERGGFNGADDIVAAEFVNRGKTFRAVRFIDKEGYSNYYTPEGNALQKAFLSTPVDFARISSHFNSNRRHPVLNRIRAHKGVDYAARTGTPVKATGSGKIAFLGRKGGYGQVVIIKHGDRYETVYAHLSKYKSELQEGSMVRQGEVIGYVGQTGLATGPHLHYEFRIDGLHQNPLTAQLSNSIPFRSMALADFKSQTQVPLAKLNLIKANSLFVKNVNAYN
ncbi:peptidoglycan DD-metalloendopeptidase family protein [Methyloglobulus sp.]|uniref:peptidoglycan DD-metalloendopeptidase family protein n=1 Tax=Methyloglobulus sp. TaxID=2518622 RepID=UPI003989936E